MPNRILRDWTEKESHDGLSADAERLLVRLTMKADDYGRFHSNPRLVRAACYPLAEDLRANTVAAWLTELSDRHLVFCYKSGTGQYLAIRDWDQRLRSKVSKFPPPDGQKPDWCPPNDGQMTVIRPPDDGHAADDCQSIGCHPRSESETETRDEKTPCGPPKGDGELFGASLSEKSPKKPPRWRLKMDDAKIVLDHLNAASGHVYEKVDGNLSFIAHRLLEPGVTQDGAFQMIDRMVAKWKSDPKMHDFLRPETLFGPQKFRGYYDTRNEPVQKLGINGKPGNKVINTPEAYQAEVEADKKRWEHINGQ